MSGELLAGLNPEQRRAVTTLEGPLLVLAGAGSGKTRVLTHRVAHLLNTGVEAEAVLAVTFTNKAAQEMKGRIADQVGSAANHAWVSTFHSTCCRILRQDIVALGYTKRFSIWDDDDTRRLVRQLIKDAGLDLDRTPPNDVLRRIDQYKNRLLDPQGALDERRSHPGDPFLRIWRTYEDTLQASDALDFNDLIGLVVKLFKGHPAIRAKWTDRFRYVLVDEYQDTNAAQYALLRLLTDERRNIAVVGDDDQSIYGFRGADVNNILSFERDFPDAVVVRLEQNYRSTGHILSAANAVVAPNTGRLPKSLWTEAPPGGRVQMVLAEHPRAEADTVARMAMEMRRDGFDWADFAIIYRTNLMSRPLEAAFQKHRIPHKVVGGRKFWERREVRDVLAWLRLIANRANDAAFLRAVGAPTRGIGPKTLATLREEAAKTGVPLLQAARMTGGTSAGERALVHFASLVAGLGDLSQSLSLPEFVRRVIEDSGYRASLDVEGKEDRKERMEGLDALVEEASHAAAEAETANPLSVLDNWLDQASLAADADERPSGGEVSMLTVHSAKGLEYPVVFVIQLMEDTFPHAKAGDDGLEEERRLAYVAFTRARKKLVLCRSRRGDGPHAGTQRPSRFLFGLPAASVVGDLPDGEPDQPTPRVVTLDERKRQMLRTLARRSTTASTDEEIEDAEQLRRGTRVRHGKWGPGTVLGWDLGRLEVRFDDGRIRPVLGSEALRLIVQE